MGAWWKTVLDPFSSRYAENEKRNINEAWIASQASPEERAMMAAQMEAFKQSLADRKATRALILAQMGYKVGKDSGGNDALVPLSREERLQAMTAAQKARASAATAYTERAQAAMKGQTKLPSFLKSNIDYHKEKEEALLSEMLGPGYENSTAAKQVVSEMRKKEEDIRQQLQENDIAVTPGMAQGIRSQLEGEATQKIGMYEALPQMSESLMRSRASLLGNMQQRRLSAYQYRLGELENKRERYKSTMSGIMSLVGMAMGGVGSLIGPLWSSVANSNSLNAPQLGLMNYNYGLTPKTTSAADAASGARFRLLGS